MLLLVLSCFFRWRKQIFQTQSRKAAEFVAASAEGATHNRAMRERR